MNTNQITKFFIVVLFALFTTFGLGIVAEQVGLDVTPTAYACGSAAGGGC